MLPIRTILVPADFSDGSKFAFGLARAIARDYGARIVVMHAVEPPQAMGVEGVLVFQPETNWQSFQQRLCENYPEDAQVSVERLVVEGIPASEIARIADEFRADVIVMGTHGRSGLSRLIMGSVAEQVVRRAACPVVTVKQPVHASGTMTPVGAEPVATTTAGTQGGIES